MCYIPYVPNIPPPSSAETKNSKKVRFNLGVRVVLIPTRIEYRDIGLTDLIWWNENDYCIFRNGAAEELEIAVEYFQVDSKEAIKLLYQPEFDNMCRFLEQSPRLERLPSNRGLQDSMSVDSIPNFSPIPMKAPLIQLPLVVPVQVGSHNRET